MVSELTLAQKLLQKKVTELTPARKLLQKKVNELTLALRTGVGAHCLRGCTTRAP